MTEERLNQIEARVDAATPGPWDTICASLKWDCEKNEYTADSLSQTIIAEGEFLEMREEDQEFITHAREDVPALIAALREARTVARDYFEWDRNEYPPRLQKQFEVAIEAHPWLKEDGND